VAVPWAPAQELDDGTVDAVRPIPYVVAAPRAALVGPPATTDALRPVYGAAYNFPRRNGMLTVRLGTVVAFRLGHNIEGVWYPDTFGHLGTSLRVELLVRHGTDAARRWKPLGRDGARAMRAGPSIGTADVRVRHRFDTPGYHVLRAIVRTAAVPVNANTDAVSAAEPSPGAADVEDIIYIVVRAVDADVEVTATADDPLVEFAEPLEPEDEAIDETGDAEAP